MSTTDQSTTIIPRATSVGTPTKSCPSWCIGTEADHAVLRDSDGGQRVEHVGPDFGPNLYVGATTDAETGELLGCWVRLGADHPTEVTSAELHKLGAGARVAAEWLETRATDAGPVTPESTDADAALVQIAANVRRLVIARGLNVDELLALAELLGVLPSDLASDTYPPEAMR